MSSRTFDRDTLLDLTVNMVPLAILGIFITVFIVYSPGPFAFESVASTLQFAIVGTTFVLLAVLTYYSGKAVAGAEKRLDTHAETATYNPEADEDDHAEPEAELDEGDAEDETDPELPSDEE